jgi:acyl-coenzyme A synthetase/AMP-(fatty) acid ligase
MDSLSGKGDCAAFEDTAIMPSVLHGPSNPPLLTLTLSGLLDLQCRRFGPKEALIIPWTGARWTYNDLRDQSIAMAKTILDLGIRSGDRVGIMAGNCEQYAAVTFAAARVGAILVVLNTTYTAAEALRALRHTGCRLLFTTPEIGKLDNSILLSKLCREPNSTPLLEEIFIMYGDSGQFRTYEDAVSLGHALPNDILDEIEATLNTHETAILMFTSGSTGNPKAASLTHQ